MDNLIKELVDTQSLFDKTLREIGIDYLIYSRTNNTSIIERINEKVEFVKILESQIQTIERKIRELKN